MSLLDIFRRARRAARNDGEPPEAPGISVVVHPLTADGTQRVELAHRISRVTAANLTAVTEHRIERHFGSVSHFLRFCNGGAARFAYTLNGDLLEFACEKLAVTFAGDGSVTFDLPRPQTEKKP